MSLSFPRSGWLRSGTLGLVLVGAAALVGWHTHDDDHGALRVTGADGVTRDLGEWRLGESDGGELPSVKAGQLSFELENADSIAHNFALIRTDLAGDELPTNVDGSVNLEAAGDFVGDVQAFAPGEGGSATFDVDAGSYVLFCDLPGHYDGGMYYTLTVEE